jgi:hypothetical protein
MKTMTGQYFLSRFLLTVCLGVSSVVAQTTPAHPAEGTTKLAVMPFEVQGITSQETRDVQTAFVAKLEQFNRFSIIPQPEVDSLLADAKFQDLSQCNYSACVADFGKIVGAQKVIRGVLIRRGKLYTLRTMIVNVANADILEDKTEEYSGELSGIYSDLIPKVAGRIGGTKLESTDYRWLMVGAAVLVLATSAYFLAQALKASSAPGTPNTDMPPGTQ